MKLGANILHGLKSIRYFKKRVLLVLFGFTFAFGLIFSGSIWQDTSEILIIDEMRENTDYLASATTVLSGGKVEPIMEYLPFNEDVESFDLSIQTSTIFNANNKSEDYQFWSGGIFGSIIQDGDPVSISNTIVTNLTAMPNIERLLNIEGRMPSSSNEMLMSHSLAIELEERYNWTIEPNTNMNVSVARRFPNTDIGENQLKHFERKLFDNVTVAGLFEHNGATSITQDIYTSDVFDRLVIFPLTDQTFNTSDIWQMDSNTLVPNLMIEFERDSLIGAGINGLEEFLELFNERIEVRFLFSSTRGQYEMVADLKSQFLFSFNASYLYYPLIFLSLLLSHYTIGQLLYGRNKQINVLRQRGANDYDLVSIIAVEFIVIGILGLLIGTPLSLALAAIIPSLKPNGTVDFEIVQLFFKTMEIDQSVITQTALIIGGIYLASIIFHTVNLVISSKNVSAKEEKINLFYDIVKSGAFIFFVSILIFRIFELEALRGFGNQTFTQGQVATLSQSILILCIVWLLFSQFLSEGLIWVLGKFDLLYRMIIPKVNYFVKRNFSKRNSNTKLFAFYLIFLFSVLIFSSSLYATYDNYKSEEHQFLNGAPLRIHTERVDRNFAYNISEIPGVNQVSPIFRGSAYISNVEYTVYAVHPDSYLQVGYWEHAEGSAPPEELIDRINHNTSSVLISQDLSDRLGLVQGQDIRLNSFQGRYDVEFDIRGLLNSAPGLGLSGSENPELNQHTRGWLMISLDYAMNAFDLDPIELFLASTDNNVTVDQVSEELRALGYVKNVNPNPINLNFIGTFVNKYLPYPRAILLFSGLIGFIISFLLLILLTDFILDSRKREYALLIAIGGKRSKISRLINAELLITGIFSLLLGAVYGILISKLSMVFFVPFTLKKIILPIVHVVDFKLISIVFGIFLLEIILVIQYSKKRILPRDITNILLERE